MDLLARLKAQPLPFAVLLGVDLVSKTNFIGAARVGSRVTAEAKPLHRGRRTSVWRTQITTEDGKLVAVVTQTQLVL